MAKLFASEAGVENSLEAMRIHGGYGYSQEFPVERYYRDAPLMIIGEGTNEIQRTVIARGLLRRYAIDARKLELVTDLQFVDQFQRQQQRRRTQPHP